MAEHIIDKFSYGGNTYILQDNTSGYIKSDDLPTKTSDLNNDGDGTSAFATLDDIGHLGGGTVTSITLKAGSGIALDTDNTAITTSGTRTISHADTSSQASSSNSGRTYIQSLTLDTYGHVTGISTATETVTNTDTKLQVQEVTSAQAYYPIVGSGTTAATRQYDTSGFLYKGVTGTTSSVGRATITLGNDIESGTANNKKGQLQLYGPDNNYVLLEYEGTNSNRIITFPDMAGTVALTRDIPTKTSDLTNDSGFITNYTETDPIFSASPAAGITSADITNWNGKSSTDEKVKAIALPTTSSTYYLVLGSNSGTAETKNYSDKLAFEYSSSQVVLKVGDTTSNQKGRIYLYGHSTGGVTYLDTAATISRSITLPDKTGTIALISDIPTSTGSSTTGITASTTATKTTLGTATSIYGVKSGDNSTTTASKASGSNGSASTWTFEEKSIPNVTAAGSGSFTSTVTNHVLSFSHTHTAPTIGTAIKVQSKSGGGNGTAPSWTFSDVTVPIRADSATSVPNVFTSAATVTITDSGHTHTLS